MTRLCVAALFTISAAVAADKITEMERVEIVRNLSSEYATLKESIPRSKKPLDYPSVGKYDQAKWAALIRENGPAARLGDQIQITKVSIESDKIIFEINGGLRNNKHWYDHASVGMGGSQTPIGRGDATATTGTSIALEFNGPIGELDTGDIKKMLAPILDFDKRSATQVYADTLPLEIKKAIADKRAQVGMDRDQVLLALGRPEHKSRETKDGDEIEDWIYGRPPGKMTFVTFNGSKCSKVKETYAGLGADAAAPLEDPH